jgi:putative DNA primase/helicase
LKALHFAIGQIMLPTASPRRQGCVLRALIDPNVAPVRTTPREERELFVSARNSYMLAFDNLSNILPWISDALCRLASGSFAVRRLDTDDDQVLFQDGAPCRAKRH